MKTEVKTIRRTVKQRGMWGEKLSCGHWIQRSSKYNPYAKTRRCRECEKIATTLTKGPE